MKLTSLTVQRYRSISQARRLEIKDLTVLIGPNNEGKSNILLALKTALELLTRGARLLDRSNRYPAFLYEQHYDWKRDFPVQLQSSSPNGSSVLRLEFELTPDELHAFQERMGSSLKNPLPLEFTLSREFIAVRVAKQGLGAKQLSRKAVAIAKFVSQRLQFEYIPSIRTAERAEEVAQRLLADELEQVEDEPAYKKALGKIEELQRPHLKRLADRIKDSLQRFLPDVANVVIQIPPEKRSRALRTACEVIIDDGTPTALQYKGDGVQSLAALAIMRHASELGTVGVSRVIALEEPESHLHPEAIHALRAVIADLAKANQIILSTHCPLFVNRTDVKSNILVRNNRARPARDIEELRSTLGVRASDNLTNAELVLIVEGDDDRRALAALLKHHSQTIAAALNNGTLAIEPLGGGTNLGYKATLFRNMVCRCHCFLDDDACGRAAFDKARLEGILTDADVNFATCPGLAESELEDLYDPTLYLTTIDNTYRTKLVDAKPRGTRKWSDRMRDAFRQHGKPWDDRVKQSVKDLVASVVEASPAAALHAKKRGAFDGLTTALEQRLAGKEAI